MIGGDEGGKGYWKERLGGGVESMGYGVWSMGWKGVVGDEKKQREPVM